MAKVIGERILYRVVAGSYRLEMLPRRGCAAAPSSTVAADAAVCERPASWTVEEVRDAEQVEKPLAHEPLPADDRLIFHHGDVGGRTAEGGETQA